MHLVVGQTWSSSPPPSTTLVIRTSFMFLGFTFKQDFVTLIRKNCCMQFIFLLLLCDIQAFQNIPSGLKKMYFLAIMVKTIGVPDSTTPTGKRFKIPMKKFIF